ncbi:MFS transporter [Paenibacillus sp. KN14-4R]|uniref:MFS transporter n=1 Tax=Paenibacillus sp. KN14-4R TaxID=3445773 RepID=UPI003FA01171
MSGASSMSSFFKNRFVQSILLSGLFLQIGIWVRNLGVLMFVMEKTNKDAFAVSMISVAEYAPIFIFSFIGGAFADRWRPKRTMITCEILSAISILAVLLTLEFGTWRAVFFATLVSAILSQFSQPSGMKLFKAHVPEEQMQMGMSINQTMQALFMILGPIVGTYVYVNLGIDASIAVTGAAFVLSALALTWLPADRMQDVNKVKTNIGQELMLGFRYVLGKKSLTLLGGCFIAAGLGIGLVQPLGIFIITERLQLTMDYLQWLLTVNGVAMIIGAIIVMGLSKKLKPQHLLAIGLVGSASTMILVSFSTVLWLTLIGQFISGLVLPCIQIGISTMILKNSDEAYLGRVNGILNPLFIGSMVITMSFSGWLKNMTSLLIMYEITAALFVVGVFIMLPLLKRGYEEKESVQVGALQQDASQASQ